MPAESYEQYLITKPKREPHDEMTCSCRRSYYHSESVLAGVTSQQIIGVSPTRIAITIGISAAGNNVFGFGDTPTPSQVIRPGTSLSFITLTRELHGSAVTKEWFAAASTSNVSFMIWETFDENAQPQSS